jgi:hypothetical protein
MTIAANVLTCIALLLTAFLAATVGEVVVLWILIGIFGGKCPRSKIDPVRNPVRLYPRSTNPNPRQARSTA